MVLDFESGRSLAEFFKRTTPLRAASRASIWFSWEQTWSGPMFPNCRPVGSH